MLYVHLMYISDFWLFLQNKLRPFISNTFTFWKLSFDVVKESFSVHFLQTAVWGCLRYFLIANSVYSPCPSKHTNYYPYFCKASYLILWLFSWLKCRNSFSNHLIPLKILLELHTSHKLIWIELQLLQYRILPRRSNIHLYIIQTDTYR